MYLHHKNLQSETKWISKCKILKFKNFFIASLRLCFYRRLQYELINLKNFFLQPLIAFIVLSFQGVYSSRLFFTYSKYYRAVLLADGVTRPSVASGPIKASSMQLHPASLAL